MKTYLSIDVGGTAIKYGLLHENGTILSTDSVPTPKDSIEGFYKTLDEIVSPVLQMISGIAISMPGRIDNQTGHVHTGGAISSYMTNVPLGTLLSERYHLPVAIENDGKCAALAELWLGNLKDVDSGAVMLVGYGIGGGIILNRRLYRGIHAWRPEASAFPPLAGMQPPPSSSYADMPLLPHPFNRPLTFSARLSNGSLSTASRVSRVRPRLFRDSLSALESAGRCSMSGNIL